MAFIDPAEIEQLKTKITDDPSQLGKLYKSKKNDYYIKSVAHNLVEEMQAEGWEEFGTPLKTKTRFRKLKNHSAKFEDDIWCQLYELGYRCLNFSDDFKLPFGKNPLEKKQIDVIAVNEDSILLVECKSSQKFAKAPPLRTEFEVLPARLEGFRKTLEQLFGNKDRRVKYIFATRNMRLDNNSADIKRLKEVPGSFFYNDNTYKYVNSLIKSYKNAAHYQFLALLFKGELISKNRIEVPAIEGQMGGKTYYMFSLEPHLLLKMGFILHRTRANEAEMPTYQRLLVPNRLRGIAKFIENGGYFPNSVILNFSKQRGQPLLFEASSPRGSTTRSRHGMLKIPNAYAIAYIIDGQHRVYGYAQSDYKESNTIPVVAFHGLDSTEQLGIFMDINENQKAVSATLRITLEEDLYWNSNKADSRMKALRSSIIQDLGGNISEPLYNRISIGEDKALLAAKPFATALINSGLLPVANGNQYVPESTETSLYNVHNHDHSSEMNRSRNSIVEFINLCYQFVEDCYPDVFNDDKNFIISNRGTYAFIRLIGSLNVFESNRGNVNVKTAAEKRFETIKEYLEALLVEIQNLSQEDKEPLFGRLGSGADIVWFRFFQSLVNKKYPQYEPPGLIDWKERQDQELQDRGRKLAIEIEKYIKNTVIEILKNLFGDNWDIEIGAIQRECEARAREEIEKRYKEGLGRQDIEWTEMFHVTDYKKIIEKYWVRKPEPLPTGFKSFEEILSVDIGYDFKSKRDKTKWLSFFNSYRNNLAHEGTKEKGLNQEEVSRLQSIHDRLLG